MLREFRFLLPFLRRYTRYYVAGAIFIVASVGLKVLIPKFIGGSIDLLRGMGEQVDAGHAVDLMEVTALLVKTALTIFAVAVATALTRTASRLCLLGVSRRAVHDVRNAVFDRLLCLSPSFYVRHQTGEIMSRCVNDMQNVQGLMGPVFMYLAETATLYAVCLTVMWRIDPILMVLGFLPFPFFIGAARKQAAKIQRGSRAVQEGLAEVSAKVDESLSGHMVIKSLTLEERDRERFAHHCAEYRRLNLEVTWARATLMPMMMALAGLSIVVVLSVGGPQTVRGRITVGDFAAMMFYLQMLAQPTGVLGFVLSALQRGTAALRRVRELSEMEITLADPPEPVDAPITHGEVTVRDLTVVFPPLAMQPPLVTDASASGREPAGTEDGEVVKPRVVLDRVSFHVPSGTTLGIVGHTGAGKTTLVSAIARQLEVEPGHIFLDGIDITAMRLANVREAVGFVPQETFLFSASLADNLALGRPAAPRADIERAADVAQLTKDLPQLYDGLDTMLGERGVNLSGGQRQRTALARVALLDPKVLILDDTLSAVDADTAEEILARLRPMMRDRTTIIVAHRVATVQHADNIIVLDEGRIVEQGTHDDLLELGGAYAALYERQRMQEAISADLGVEPDQEVA